MDLETIANAAVSNWNLNISARLTEYMLTGAVYHISTIIAPSIIYFIVKHTAERHNTKTNPLTTALTAAAIGTLPLGFLAGIMTNNNLLGFNNVAAYLFGASLLTYYHNTKSPASQAAQAPIR